MTSSGCSTRTPRSGASRSTPRRSVRREFVDVAPDRTLSALVWGTDDPQLVLLHGGAQNAHTWDTVALALGRPLVAIDLPGHGYSGPAPRRAVRAARVRARHRRRRARAGAERERARGHVARGRDRDGDGRALPRQLRAGGARRRHSRVRPGEGGTDRRVRARARVVRLVRRDPRAHHALQPDAIGVVTPARRAAQRGRASRRHLGVAPPAALGPPHREQRLLRPSPTSSHSGTTSSTRSSRSCSCAAPRRERWSTRSASPSSPVAVPTRA